MDRVRDDGALHYEHMLNPADATLFDPAWWAWSVSFSSPEVLQEAWPAFLDGAGIDAAEPGLADRIRAVQVLRMLEQLATGNLTLGIARVVTDRLHTTLSDRRPPTRRRALHPHPYATPPRPVSM